MYGSHMYGIIAKTKEERKTQPSTKKMLDKTHLLKMWGPPFVASKVQINW